MIIIVDGWVIEADVGVAVVVVVGLEGGVGVVVVDDDVIRVLVVGGVVEEGLE